MKTDSARVTRIHHFQTKDFTSFPVKFGAKGQMAPPCIESVMGSSTDFFPHPSSIKIVQLWSRGHRHTCAHRHHHVLLLSGGCRSSWVPVSWQPQPQHSRAMRTPMGGSCQTPPARKSLHVDVRPFTVHTLEVGEPAISRATDRG